jgi:hypothetical protein
MRALRAIDAVLSAIDDQRAIMTLGTPQDVTLQELRIETFFPADAESEARWIRMTDS